MSAQPIAIDADLDDDLDASLADGDPQVRIPIIVCAASDDARALSKQMELSQRFEINAIDYSTQMQELEEAEHISVLLFEIRTMEAFEDLLLVRALRSKRPLLPILALSTNDDLDFTAEAFRAGVNDYILIESTSPEVLRCRLESFAKLGESSRLIEIQNAELIRTMRAQRKADEEKMTAEKQRAEAQAQAHANRRTREILDHLQEGFFIVDTKLQISDVVSKSCAALFGRDIAGQGLDAVLGLKDRGEEFIKVALEQVFDDFLPREVSRAMIPTRCVAENGKILDFSYTLIPEDGPPEKVIVVTKDVTSIVGQQRALEEHNTLNQLLISILKDKSAFLDFVADIKRDLQTMAASSEPQLTKRVLHTLKGNTASYQLNDLAEYIHKLETELDDEDPQDLSVWGEEKATLIYNRFENFLKKHYDILQVMPDSKERVINLDEQQWLAMLRLGEQLSVPFKSEWQAIVQEATMRSVDSYLSPLEYTVSKLAERQGKVIRFKLEGNDVKIDGERFGTFFKNLVHAVRNACDHGIEDPNERLGIGKPEHGTISIKVEKIPGQLSVTISDDGRGIRTELLIAGAVAKGLISQQVAAKLTTKEAYKLMFHDGLSTSDQVTDISGRGIGMSCIRQEATRWGGKIAVGSKKGVGTKIVVTFPL